MNRPDFITDEMLSHLNYIEAMKQDVTLSGPNISRKFNLSQPKTDSLITYWRLDKSNRNKNG